MRAQLVVLTVVGVAAGWACGTEGTARSQPTGAGGSGASSAGGTSGASAGGTPGAGGVPAGGAGGSATGGSSGSGAGATGGTSVSDASYPDVKFVYDATGGTGGLTEDGSCANTSVEGTLDLAPADIIFAVDTSGSMNLEQGWTQNEMPNFVNAIAGSGIDAHVVLIANNEMCVPPPLGSGTCNGTDTNLPNYLHVNVSVGSNNALNRIHDSYGQWSSMLRPNSVKSFVVVSDDNATDGPLNSSNAFRNAINALDPALIQPNGWVFHAIFAFQAPFIPGPCFFPIAAAEGTVYRQLVMDTGGVQGDLCQQNFTPVFNQLATSVVNSAPLSCDIPMPTTDAGIVNPDDVKIELTLPPNPPQVINNVGSSGACGGGGWYYDNPSAPSQITLCPETCNAANAVSNPQVSVLLGCLGS